MSCVALSPDFARPPEDSFCLAAARSFRLVQAELSDQSRGYDQERVYRRFNLWLGVVIVKSRRHGRSASGADRRFAGAIFDLNSS
jgi:hypothetical protein